MSAHHRKKIMKRRDFALHWYGVGKGKNIHIDRDAWDGTDKGLIECLEFMTLCEKHAIFYETTYYECPLCHIGAEEEDLPHSRIYATGYEPKPSRK